MRYKITDHALVRIIERRYGVDVDAIRRQVDAHIRQRMPDPQVGEWTLNTSDGLKFAFKGNILKTVIDKKNRNKPR